MGKLPGFTFYIGDWTKDPELRRCSKSAKGVWIDMLALMFECVDRGVLATGGVPWTDEEIAAAIGGDIAENLSCIRELLSKGVARRNNSGAIFSARMVRDEQERKSTKDRVAKHRRGSVTQSVTPNVTPSVTPMYGDGNGDGNVIGSVLIRPSIPLNINLESFHSDERFQSLCRIHPRPEKGQAAQVAYMEAVEREVNPTRPNRNEIADAIEQAAGVYKSMFYRDELDVVYGLTNWLQKGIWCQDPKVWERRKESRPKSSETTVGMHRQTETDRLCYRCQKPFTPTGDEIFCGGEECAMVGARL